MVPSHRQLEWHLIEAESEEAPPAHFPTDRARRNQSHGSTRWHRLYELILGVALLYSCALYFIWQQAEHRMAALEQEMAALRSELSAVHGSGANSEEVATEHGESTRRYQLASGYLRFETSARASGMVKLLDQRSDEHYQQLHRDFGVALPSPEDALVILVDRPVPSTDEKTLIIPWSESAVKQHGITMEEALENEIRFRLSHHVLHKALRGRVIKPQWQAMTQALETHLRVGYGHDRDGQSDRVLLSLRHRAQSNSIDLIQEMQYAAEVQYAAADQEQIELGLQPSLTAHATASPLIEYILETHGYAVVPALLDAFEDHESWETLAPAVFGISAGEFEEDWHAYLGQAYPQAKE